MIPLFKEQVYEVTKLIPKGRVSTYGAIAKAVGYPNHSRHVGNPAHRVISGSGKLSVPSFRERLEKEDVLVQENGKIKDFKKLFWNPLEEL
jgi:methylated-DNA-protein-cysteine methyltransferase-like protein